MRGYGMVFQNKSRRGFPENLYVRVSGLESAPTGSEERRKESIIILERETSGKQVKKEEVVLSKVVFEK